MFTTLVLLIALCCFLHLTDRLLYVLLHRGSFAFSGRIVLQAHSAGACCCAQVKFWYIVQRQAKGRLH